MYVLQYMCLCMSIYVYLYVPVCQSDDIILVETPLLSNTLKFSGRSYKHNLITGVENSCHLYRKKKN